MPCMKHENVSRRLAVRRGDIPKRSAMLRAMDPEESIATVLLAVHTSANITIEAMAASAPRRVRMRAVRRDMM